MRIEGAPDLDAFAVSASDSALLVIRQAGTPRR